MNFHVQFGIKKHSQIFQRLLVLIYSKLHSKSFAYLYELYSNVTYANLRQSPAELAYQ